MAAIGLVRRSLIEPVLAPYVAAERPPDDELERYRRDPFAHLDATETWVDDTGVERAGHIFIPLIESGETGPLRPMVHQEDFVEEWIDLDALMTAGRLVFRNIHVEKTRQMGMTWILAYLVWWLLTYHEARGGYSNMNAAEVDDGGDASTIDSFFGKIRWIQDHAPPRFRAPLRFTGGNHPLIRWRGVGHGFIVGRGAVASPGRGGTYDYWIVDEASRFPHGEAAHAALGRACPTGRVMNSTPFGESNVYFRAKKEQWRDWRYVSYHWSDHPFYSVGMHVAAIAPSDTGEPGRLAEQPSDEARAEAETCPLCVGTMQGLPWSATERLAHRYPGKLTSPWYEDAIVGFTDDQVASEIDIDYAGSLPARVYTEFDRRVHSVERIPYDPSLLIELALDYGLDYTSVAILQDAPREIRQIGEVEVTDHTPDQVTSALLATLRSLGVPAKELEPQFRRDWLAIGDPSAEGREVATGKSIKGEYARNGWTLTTPDRYRVTQTVIAVKRILNGRPKPYRVSRETCPETIRHWQLNRWPIDRNGNRKPGATRPEDDEHNHMMRALAYYLTHKYPAPDTDEQLDEAVELARLRQRDGILTDARYGMKL